MEGQVDDRAHGGELGSMTAEIEAEWVAQRPDGTVNSWNAYTCGARGMHQRERDISMGTVIRPAGGCGVVENTIQEDGDGQHGAKCQSDLTYCGRREGGRWLLTVLANGIIGDMEFLLHGMAYFSAISAATSLWGPCGAFSIIKQVFFFHDFLQQLCDQYSLRCTVHREYWELQLELQDRGFGQRGCTGRGKWNSIGRRLILVGDRSVCHIIQRGELQV